MTIARHIYAILGLTAVLTTLSISSTTFKAAPPSPSTVTVSNTAANPIPTTIQGTANISGNVNVVNTAANPVATKEVKTRTYISLHKETQFLDGTTAAENVMYTVPAGKRFFVTDFSGEILLPIGQQPRELELRDQNPGGGIVINPVPMIHQCTGFNQDVFDGARDGATIPVEAGHVLSMYGMRTDTPNQGYLETTIAGYLEDAN